MGASSHAADSIVSGSLTRASSWRRPRSMVSLHTLSYGVVEFRL